MISSSDYAFRARRVFHPRNWVIGKVWCCGGKTEAGGEVDGLPARGGDVRAVLLERVRGAGARVEACTGLDGRVPFGQACISLLADA